MKTMRAVLTTAMLASLIGIASAADTNWTAVWDPLIAMIEGLQPLFPALLVLFIAAMPLIIGMAIVGMVLGIIALLVLYMKKSI